MCSGRVEARVVAGRIAVLAIAVLVSASAAAFDDSREASRDLDAPAAGLSAAEVVHRADAYRGVGGSSRFIARIATVEHEGNDAAAAVTVVDVRANGFAAQLVTVLAPSRGDVLLSTPDVVWLRPRRLHRLTRIPPDLRMFNGASVGDVTAVDLLASYTATFADRDEARDDGDWHGAETRDGAEDHGAAEMRDGDVILVELRAAKQGVRYPRATYRIGADFRPARIDFRAANGTPLKTLAYAEFTTVGARTVASTLIVDDRVRHERTIVTMSEFERLPDADPASFSPEALLALPDSAS